MTDTVNYFSGAHRFLSNFYPAQISWCGTVFPTAEHLYQARKTRHPEWRHRIAAAPTAAEAKSLGQQAPLAPRWDDEKVGVMEEVLGLKFTGHLAHQLAGTGNANLTEGNTWHDQFWGDCNCDRHRSIQGHNALGILLMRLRLNL